MAKNETKRINPVVLQDDKDTFNAAQSITGLAPANTAYSVANVQTSLNAMYAAQAAWTQAQAAADTARDNAVAAEWTFHNNALGLKNQVVAQFGPDSNEVQAVGLKKKSEYKSRSRNGKATPAHA